jgi:D-alanine-D-alanine ligase
MSTPKKPILIMFGGESAEHEVSIISGLQVVEKVDRTLYQPHVVYVGKHGEMHYLGGIAGRREFKTVSRKKCLFGKDTQGGYLQIVGTAGSTRALMGGMKLYPYAAFCAFHGGTGEAGQYQGLLEACGIAHTGSRTEGAVIAMNKRITNELLAYHGVPTALGMCVFADDIKKNSLTVAAAVANKIGLPAIVKPVHLGSSIGITVARDVDQLERALIGGAHVDSELLVEEFLTDFVEYNISLRTHNGELECSAIEKPLSKDEILSFADKYQRGGSKKGGTKQVGMAFLDRELPAKISIELRERIETQAKKAYKACAMSGCPRIDFMYKSAVNELYLTEINPIPGSIAYFLWEAVGIPYTQQVTDALEQAVVVQKSVESKHFDYTTDIVDRFCA